MTNIELIRSRVTRGQASELTRLRIFLSSTDGNQDCVDRLHGSSGALLLAKVTDLIMRELGHETDASVEDPNSLVRRAVRRVRGTSK